MATILIVDDSAPNRMTLAAVLDSANHLVVEAEDGIEALALARARAPYFDLIICELLMLRLDGYEFVRALRSDPVLARTPVVFWSATFAQPETRQLAERCGVRHVLGKQAGPEEIMEIVADALSEPIVDATLQPVFDHVPVVQLLREKLYKRTKEREQDITDREQAADTLRESEANYRTLVELASAAIFIVDLQGRMLDVNAAGCRMFDYTREELLAMKVADLVPAWEVPRIAPHVERLKVGEVLRSDWQCRRKDGIIFPVQVSATLLPEGQLMGIVRDITKRKQAEESLRNSEEWRKTILRTAMDGFWRVDIQGRLLEVNEAYCQMSGYSEQELLTMSIPNLDILETPAKIGAHMQKIMAQGADRFETRHRRKDGSSFEVEISVQYKPEGGQVVAFLRDITERKLAEAALRESEAKFRALAETSPAAIFVFQDESFCYFNSTALKMLGCSAEEFGRMKFWDVIHPEHSQLVKERGLARQRGEDIPNRYQVKILTKEGRGVWVDFAANMVDWNGSKAVLGVAVEITERKRAEEELQQTLESLRKAVGTTIQVMVSAVEARDPYTSGHQVRSADLARAIATELGLPQEEIEGMRMAGSIHDIGKLSIPAEILSKPTKLTDIEYSLIKEHSRKGYEMLKDVKSPWPLAEIVYQHHERMDGSGYPRKLKGEEILMEARILAVADTVEAMASHRPYRPGLGIDAALNEIEKNRGIFYDDAVADACLGLFREKGYQLNAA